MIFVDLVGVATFTHHKIKTIEKRIKLHETQENK